MPVAVERDTPSQAPPGDADVMQGLGCAPFHESGFADGKQRRAAAAVLLAHGIHAPLAEAVVEAERAPMILPGPGQESLGGILRPDRPLTKGDGALLRLGREAHEGIAQGEGRDPEVLFKELEESLVYTVVPG
jgi:hypothetical protein